MEPLRSEIDSPSRARALLRARRGRVLVTHAVAPAIIVTAAGALTAGACAIAGVLSDRDGGAVALVAIAAAPTIALCAGLSARRGGQMPLNVLTVAVTTDPTGGAGVVLSWLLLWPLVAVTLGAAPTIARRERHWRRPADRPRLLRRSAVPAGPPAGARAARRVTKRPAQPSNSARPT